MKSGGEAALAADEIRPALEDLRGQTGGHTSWLTGEGTSHIKPSGRVAAGYHLDRADGLRPRLLCSVQCIFGGGCARLDLRHVEVARKALLRSEEHTSELQSLTNLVCRLLLEKKKIKIKTS